MSREEAEIRERIDNIEWVHKFDTYDRKRFF